MSLQVISQILSPTNATYINGTSAERRVAAAILKNSFQGLVEKNNKGVNDKWVTETDAVEAAQVFVNRILPVKMKPRELGASKNGASFSANQHYPQTETVGIEILQILDDPIIIPRANQDMIKVDLLAEHTKIYSDRLKTIINGATAASKILAVYDAKRKGKEVNEKVISSTDITNKNVLNKFIEANSLLDDGDQEHGIDIFEEDSRIAVFKTSWRATLKTGGVLTLGGANAAYDIAKGDAISTDSKARKVEDGYVGDIDGVPCHLISNESLQHAAGYLGFPEKEFLKNDFAGYIASSYANARGVSTTEQVKIVPAQAGQGLVFQPYTKFGVVSWYPKGNVIITAAEYNPLKELADIFSADNLTFKLKGAGSRLFPTVAFSAKTNAAFTVTASANDDFDTDHVVATGGYVVCDHVCETVGDFLKAYNTAANESGTFTVGTSKSLTASLTSGKVCNVLVAGDDGSFTLASYPYAA